jgi:hypothetical protein
MNMHWCDLLDLLETCSLKMHSQRLASLLAPSDLPHECAAYWACRRYYHLRHQTSWILSVVLLLQLLNKALLQLLSFAFKSIR